MNRVATAVLLLLMTALSAISRNYSPSVYIGVQIHNDGSATLTQTWRIISDEGTEGYLAWGDIGDSEILDLRVSDEQGRVFVTEQGWDIDRSLSAKAQRCGIRRIGEGGELCWGLGEYGDHSYTLQYTVTNIVKSMEDYDCLHWQFIAPGMDIAPHQATLALTIDGHLLDPEESPAWGFGFEGETVFDHDGSLILRSTEAFEHSSRMILLMRIPKSWVEAGSIRPGKFQDALDAAMQGADFGEESDDEGAIWGTILMLLCILGGIVVIVTALIHDRRQIVGCKIREITWSRTVPFDGDIYASEYILNKLAGTSDSHEGLTRAMILRLIYNGYLTVNTDNRGHVELGFGRDPSDGRLKSCERGLIDILKASAGSDMVLQHNEFSKWARRHYKAVDKWSGGLSSEGPETLMRMNLPIKSAACQPKAREVIGFKKYLEDFTLSEERKSAEVMLWQDYLVFAALYGIADRVSEELRDINPDIYRDLSYGGADMRPIIVMTNSYSHSVVHAVDAANSAAAGHGGRTSFGGGGGFSGGFSGGGTR